MTKVIGTYVAALCLSMTTSAARAEIPKPGPLTDALRVTVTPVLGVWKVSARNEFLLEVKNVSGDSHSIEIMSCSWYDHWYSDNRHVGLSAWPCFGNYLRVVTLSPGATWTETMVLGYNPETIPSRVRFALGFMPHKIDGSVVTPCFWSDTVSLPVER